MNELVRIGEHEGISIEYRKSDSGKMECYLNGIFADRFWILSYVLEQETPEEARAMLNIAERLFGKLGDEVFNKLYFAVQNTVMDRFWNYGAKNEFYYQKMFNETYSKIRDGKVVTHENDGKNIPDSWVMIGNDLYPVEVKREKFDVAAMRQLTRYIKAYKTKGGIAVGKTLKTILPPNVEFISISELEEAATA